MLSSDGFRVLDQPLIANGPGLQLPIAAVFYVFGIGLLQVRILMVIYLIVTAFIFLIVVWRLYDSRAAWIALFLLLALPFEGYLRLGRQALGNVPGLCYFLLGYLLWLKWLDRRQTIHLIGAGLLYGLAMVTKGQYTLLLPMFALFVLADRLYYKQIGWKPWVILGTLMIICLGGWYLAQGFIVGWDRFGQHMASISSSSRVTVYAFRFNRLPGSVWYLIRSGVLLVVLPGFFYALWSCRKKAPESMRLVFLAIFILVWLGWYAIASVGWSRYVFDAYAIGAILTGIFFADAARFVSSNGIIFKKPRLDRLSRWGAITLMGLTAIAASVGLARQIQHILLKPDESPQQLAAYMQANIPTQAVVESWEWEIDVLTKNTFHHPTNIWVDRYTAVLHFNEPLVETYNPFANHPAYLLDGPFSKWTGVYQAYLQSNCCKLVSSFGQYDLYRVQQNP
jgi:4-amino-4-deoxy-L-arabinose transferase-like glycosyltransferase